jgi:hypothetical protein
MEQVIIKLLENPENPKLKMKYVGSLEYAVPKVGNDGKVKTGFDPNSLEVLSIEDLKKRKAAQDKIEAERLELEKLLGVELDPNSSFWDKFNVVLSDEDIPLDLTNPMDRLKEKFLVANGYVAPSLEAIEDDEKYMNCIFYIHREVEEVGKKVKKEKVQDQAIAKLNSLDSNPNQLKLVAAYLFGTSEDEFTADSAYDKIRSYLVDEKIERKRKLNIENFLEVVEKTPEQMSIKLIFDKAVRKRIISLKGGIYRRGDKIIGNSYDDAIDNLGSVEMNGELSSLIKEVKSK